jgi:hypothetical protein
MFAAVLVAAAFALASCASAQTPDPHTPIGRWGDPGEERTSLTFLEDGTVLGYDGCNSVGGSWTLTEGTVVFRDTYMTLMACPGDEQWLGGMASATVIGDLLFVLDEEGSELGVLPRVAAVSG